MCLCVFVLYVCAHIYTHISTSTHTLEAFDGFVGSPGSSFFSFSLVFVQQWGILEGARPVMTRCCVRTVQKNRRSGTNFTGKPSLTRITMAVLAFCGQREREDTRTRVKWGNGTRMSGPEAYSGREQSSKWDSGWREAQGGGEGRPIRTSDPFFPRGREPSRETCPRRRISARGFAGCLEDDPPMDPRNSRTDHSRGNDAEGRKNERDDALLMFSIARPIGSLTA